ncbi:MAG: PAS domain-containing hybrid sensor histidine kinase/response regulator [Armatimonadota bacterium]
MAKKSGTQPKSFTPLEVVGASFAALVALVGVFDIIRAGSGGGNAEWADAGLSLLAALLALAALWIARRGLKDLASWVLVLTAALRIIIPATLISPQSYHVLWPLYLLPIVMAQVLLTGQAAFVIGLGSLLMFVFTYSGLSGQPEALSRLPETACATALLYIVIGGVVQLATARMRTALKRQEQLLSSHDRARAELKEREEQFRALAESSPSGIVIHQDGHLVYGNPYFFSMAQCLNSDVFGLSLWDFFDKAGADELNAQLLRRKSLGTNAVPPNQVRFNPCKGSERWCEVAVAEAVFWQKPAIVANLLDVTDRVEAQEAVRRERDFSNNIINTADAVIMVLNGEGRIVVLNPAGERISGYSQEEVRGKFYWDLMSPPELVEPNRKLVDDLRQRRGTGEVEGPWQTRNGEEVTIAWRYVGQYDDDGELTRVVAAGIDVTRQRVLERQAMVTERLRSLGQIAGGVAHDLNNMLAGIMGPTDLLLLLETDPEKERALKGVMAAATRGAETVRRIQSFSKARTDLDKQIFDLRELTEDVIFSLRPRWKDAAQQRGATIKVTNEVPPALTVHASAGEIGNVLMNLIVNACEAMPGDGEITITGMQKGSLIQFHVSDTGAGMSEETMAQIFQPFFSTKGADNSGLGLAVIHGIILRHGGTISVDSGLGRGTTFTIALPAQLPETEAKPRVQDQQAAAGQLKILIVDDVPEIADYLVAIAARAGHEAVAEYSGEAAIASLQQQRYDVLITDYGMEGINGPDLAERAHNLHPDIKLVLVTGWDVSIEEFPLFSGMLKKPCTRQQVQDLLEKLAQSSLTDVA